MRISTRGEYGIRALLELATRYGVGYVQSTQIAGARHIPENYLFQLLITLRKAGLIRSRRGPRGGHMLARPPERISLADAVLALEGPISPALCVEEAVADDCLMRNRCAVREVWQRVTRSAQDILQDTTLLELVQREGQLVAQAEQAR